MMSTTIDTAKPKIGLVRLFPSSISSVSFESVTDLSTSSVLLSLSGFEQFGQMILNPTDSSTGSSTAKTSVQFGHFTFTSSASQNVFLEH